MIDIGLFMNALNPYFEGFMPPKVELQDRSNQWMRFAYLDPQGARLLDRCQQHAEQFRSGRQASGAVVVTHPFYTILEDPATYLADAGYQAKIDSVVENLSRLITDIDRARFELVFVDVPQHYARFNSWFLEAGLVDDVVFTDAASGYPLQDPNILRWKKVVERTDSVSLGGEYEDLCASQTREVLFAFAGREKVAAIPEIIVPTIKLHYDRQRGKVSEFNGKAVRLDELCKNGK